MRTIILITTLASLLASAEAQSFSKNHFSSCDDHPLCKPNLFNELPQDIPDFWNEDNGYQEFSQKLGTIKYSQLNNPPTIKYQISAIDLFKKETINCEGFRGFIFFVFDPCIFQHESKSEYNYGKYKHTSFQSGKDASAYLSINFLQNVDHYQSKSDNLNICEDNQNCFPEDTFEALFKPSSENNHRPTLIFGNSAHRYYESQKEIRFMLRGFDTKEDAKAYYNIYLLENGGRNSYRHFANNKLPF